MDVAGDIIFWPPYVYVNGGGAEQNSIIIKMQKLHHANYFETCAELTTPGCGYPSWRLARGLFARLRRVSA